uniref:WW domain-containing protein n=1 Tax=Elaeophora elaphi TaxID=1147741 RepID=A0A0R3RQI5_9BILA
MIPFGGPPAFSPLMNIPPNAAASQATYLQQQVIMPPLQRIPMMAVSTPPAPLQLPQVSVASPATTPRPMLVPPQMQMEIAAAAQSPRTSSIATTLITSDVCLLILKTLQIWSEHTASDGRVYYYNKVTKQSSWQKPDELKTPEEKKLAAAKLWREYKTPEGRPYYYNIETKETTWICPKDFDPSVVIKGAFSSQFAIKKFMIVSEIFSVKNGVESKGSDTSKTEPQSGGESELEKAMLATLKSLEQPNEQAGSTKEAETEDGEEEKDLKQKQSDKFRDLLRDKYNEGKISSTSSWEQAMRYIQHDPRFRILNKVSEKKQLFNAWKVQRQKEERDEKRLAIKKAKEDLEEWLQNNPKVRPTMRYSKAEMLFADEPIWKAVHEGERKEIFADALEFIDKREKENAKAVRRRNVQALADILEGMEEITYRTTWAQAQRLLIENPSFANDSTLQNMDKEDALIVFEEHIRTAEKHYLKEKDMEERRRRRQERKIREAFQTYLVELHKRGELTSISLWSELYPVISADLRFDSMLKQSGSTPLDLFKFYVEDLKSQFGQDRRVIKEILKDLNVTVEVGTTFDQLCKWVSSDERGKTVDPGNMKLCYNSLVEKAEAKEKEQEREEARKRRRHETAFRNILRTLVPPVEPNSHWEVIRPKIENEEAFITVETEQLREKFFNKESETEGEARPKKKRKHHKSDVSDEEKGGYFLFICIGAERRRKKKKKRLHSKSCSRSQSVEAVEKHFKEEEDSPLQQDRSNESELSEGELERKRKILLNKLDVSPQSS